MSATPRPIFYMINVKRKWGIVMQILATVIDMSMLFPLADIGRIAVALVVLVISMLTVGGYRVELGVKKHNV